MLLRSIRLLTTTRPVDGYFARALLPCGDGAERIVAAFVAPLQRGMCRRGLGRIARFDIETADEADGSATGGHDGEVLRLDLSMVTDAPRALRMVADILVEAGAPVGSVIGNAECPNLLTFGTEDPSDAAAGRDGTADFADDPDGTRSSEALSIALSGRGPLLAEAVHRVIAGQVEMRAARVGRMN